MGGVERFSSTLLPHYRCVLGKSKEDESCQRQWRLRRGEKLPRNYEKSTFVQATKCFLLFSFAHANQHQPRVFILRPVITGCMLCLVDSECLHYRPGVFQMAAMTMFSIVNDPAINYIPNKDATVEGCKRHLDEFLHPGDGMADRHSLENAVF